MSRTRLRTLSLGASMQATTVLLGAEGRVPDLEVVSPMLGRGCQRSRRPQTDVGISAPGSRCAGTAK